jgi:hypothetical protein
VGRGIWLFGLVKGVRRQPHQNGSFCEARCRRQGRPCGPTHIACRIGPRAFSETSSTLRTYPPGGATTTLPKPRASSSLHHAFETGPFQAGGPCSIIVSNISMVCVHLECVGPSRHGVSGWTTSPDLGHLTSFATLSKRHDPPDSPSRMGQDPDPPVAAACRRTAGSV